MKIAYLDCFAGISGDMFLGALIDLGVEVDQLRQELSKIGIQPHRHLKDIVAILENSQLADAIKQDAKK